MGPAHPEWVLPCRTGLDHGASRRGREQEEKWRETEGGKRQRRVRSKGERMEARDALASSQRSGPAHPGLKTEMEGRGCRHGADLLDLWKLLPRSAVPGVGPRITGPLQVRCWEGQLDFKELALCPSWALHWGLPAPPPLEGGDPPRASCCLPSKGVAVPGPPEEVTLRNSGEGARRPDFPCQGSHW